MAALIVILAAGLFICLISFVLVFQIKEGESSSIMPAEKRRLKSLWILSIVDLVFLFACTFFKTGFKFTTADVVAAAFGLVLCIVGLVMVTQQKDGATAEMNATLTRPVRWGLFAIVVLLGGCLIFLLCSLPEQGHVSYTQSLWLTLLMLGVITVIATLVYVFIKEKPDSLAADGDPMPMVTRRLLAVYLVAFGIGLMVLLWQIGSINFPDGGLKIETTPAGGAACVQGASCAGGGNAPVLNQLLPQTVLGATPIVYITALGQNFTSESKLRFNQQVQQGTIFIDANRIQALLDQRTISNIYPVVVDVANGNQISNVITMRVSKETVDTKLLGYPFPITRELQLLLLAVLAGALGSFIHALKSFADFTGNRTLTSSWFWWYITRPFLGAALALIFYAVVRGGFMAGTPADANSVNQFGVIAIGALVGMFADKASDKLADIFDTLFKGADSRSGKLGAPVIDHFDPAKIPHGANTTDLKIIGERLGSVKQVKFDGVVHDHGAVTDTQIIVTLTQQELAAVKTIKISVVGDNGESPAKDFLIT